MQNLEAINGQFPFTRTIPLPSTLVPERYSRHPLVQHKVFFTLPTPLLHALIDELGAVKFDRELLELELDLGRVCGDHTGQVGFRDSQLISYSFLRRKPISVCAEFAKLAGWEINTAQLQLTLDVANSRDERMASFCRGFSGWLILNQKFRAEHRDLLQRWPDQVGCFGVSQKEFTVNESSQLPEGWTRAEGRTMAYGQALQEFFTRWRLADMAAPLLPIPLAPQLPVALVPSVLGQMRHGGSTFYLPDTFPIPSRDQLREILEDVADRKHAPEHLQAWQEVVSSGNSSKNKIGHYARLFELHHFWSILHQRHGDSLDGCIGQLEEVFAAFLGTGSDSIHKDLAFLTRELGSRWAFLPWW